MVIIHRSVRAQETGDRALVLLAMGIDHDVGRNLFGWWLGVPVHEESRAREQLHLWERENHRIGPLARHTPAQPGAVAVAFTWSAILLLCYTIQTRYVFSIDWVTIGRVDVALMYAGEWWRATTALMLHADIGHVMVNIGFGATFGGLLAREIGGGLAGCMILFGGIVGNLMNTVVQRASHSSIGASTAVFAALGSLSAWLWLGRRLDQTGWARRCAPLVGAIILLAWLGTGTERTDIVAHLTGFIAGFVPGGILGLKVRTIRTTVRREFALGGLALSVIVAAWALALM
jgi:membrane associated rhomboid family serine protease